MIDLPGNKHNSTSRPVFAEQNTSACQRRTWIFCFLLYLANSKVITISKPILFALYWNVLGCITFLFPSQIHLRGSCTPPVGASLRSDLCLILRPHVSRQDPDPGPLGAPDRRCFAHYSIPLTCNSDEVGPKSNMKPFHVNKRYWEEEGSDGQTCHKKTSRGAVTMLLILQLPPIKWPI